MHSHGEQADQLGAFLDWSLVAAQHSPVAALLVFGLLVGVGHCTGMCGPLVLGRTLAVASRLPASVSHWQRVGLAALPSYHAGRATTYMAIGTLSGLAGETSMTLLHSQGTRVAFLALALVIVLLQWRPAALTSLATTWSRGLSRVAALLPARSIGAGGYGAGLVFGLLPCGMVYAAASVAATTADPFGGAAGMAAFALGTWLPLACLGAMGTVFARRSRDWMRRWSPMLLTLNVVALGAWLLHA